LHKGGGKVAKKSIEDKLLDAVEKSNLTDKQKLFCVYYVSCHNATQAYLMAYKGKKTTAETNGWLLLQNTAIQAEIARLKKIMRQEYDVDVNDYIRYLLKVVGADVGNYLKFGRKSVTKKGVTFDVNYVELLDSDNIDTSVITEVKEGRDGVTFKLEDKKWAWEQLAKYLGFEDKAVDGGEATIIELPPKDG
jgi:phage terminase small subunit